MTYKYKELEEKIKALASYDQEGFPVRSKPKGEKGISIAFGVNGQGLTSFIQRCIEDKAGWSEIAQTVGWIDYALFRSFYANKYKEEFEKLGIGLLDKNEVKFKGRLIFNQLTKKIEIIEESEVMKDCNPLKIPQWNDYILFHDFKRLMTEDKLSKTYSFDFHNVQKSQFSKICFHAFTKDKKFLDEPNEGLIKGNTILELLEVLIDQYNNGQVLVSDIFFDDPDIDDDLKKQVNKEVQNLINNFFKVE